MAQIQWAYLCDYAFVDRSGKASIIGMFENINTRQLPIKHNQFFLILSAVLERSEKTRIGVILSSPSGKEMHRVMPGEISLPKNAPETNKMYIAFGFYTIEFTEAGEHKLEIYVGDTCVHSIPFNIILIK